MPASTCGALIVRDPEILSGRPVFRGTRVPVDVLFDNLADGLTLDEILRAYPTLDRQDILTVLDLARATSRTRGLMRRVLVDECLPVQLHRWLDGFDARTVEFMGWQGRRNSELMAAAIGEFDVLLTCDAFLPREHRPADYGLALVVLTTKRLREVEQLLPEITRALSSVRPGEQVLVPRTSSS